MKARQRGVGLTGGYASTPAWLSWQTGQHRGAVHQIMRTGDLLELLPETARAWRAGEITSTAVTLIAAARVPGSDDKLVESEVEFLAFAKRRDHKSLRIATAHFPALARADGAKLVNPDCITLSDVGDRTVVSGELHSDAAETVGLVHRARSPRARDRTDDGNVHRSHPSARSRSDPLRLPPLTGRARPAW